MVDYLIYYLVHDILPTGIAACAEAFHSFVLFQPVQQVANHVEADTGTLFLQVGHAEFAGLPLDGCFIPSLLPDFRVNT